MTAEQKDLVVLGGGPAGYAAALYAASAGLTVSLVEKDRVGGTCLQRGCVPAKEFLETAAVFRSVASAAEFGIKVEPPMVDFEVSQKRKQSVVDKLTQGLTGVMKSRGIEIVQGVGSYRGDGTILVDDGTHVQGDAVVLATGSVPRTIPGFEVDGRYVLTSDEVLALTKLPRRVAIVGGGVIGCEFASLMADLGTEVTVIEALPRILPGVDQDLVDVLSRSFRRRGITVKAGVGVTGHSPQGDTTVVSLGDGTSLEVDQVVIAVGRRPFTDDLLGGTARVGIDERGFIEVDGGLQTAEQGVYAMGDAINTPQLAHVGFGEAIYVVKQLLGEQATPLDYSAIPWCIYTHPEVAFAGLTEERARELGYDVVVKKDPFGGNSRARIIGEVDGLVKVVAEKMPDGRAGRLLGVHIVGPWATELLSAGYLAINWEATIDEVAEFIQPHPTLSEAFGETVIALTGRSLHVG